MDYVRLVYDGTFYNYKGANSIATQLLGLFLSSDVGCNGKIYKKWALADKEAPDSKFNYSCGGNITYLEEENGQIYLSDHMEDEPSVRLKLSRKQFVQLLDDWWEKVCKHKPKEVTIKHENGQFVIEMTE